MRDARRDRVHHATIRSPTCSTPPLGALSFVSGAAMTDPAGREAKYAPPQSGPSDSVRVMEPYHLRVHNSGQASLAAFADIA